MPSVIGKAQMLSKLAKASWVMAGSCIPMPPYMSLKSGPMTQFQSSASASETKNPQNITMSGYVIMLLSRVQTLFCRWK